MIKEAIKKLVENEDLSYDMAKGVMNEIMSGEASQIHMGAYLTALRMKGETIEEITAALGRRVGVIAVNDAGFANKMRAEYKIDTMIRRNRSYDEEI